MPLKKLAAACLVLSLVVAGFLPAGPQSVGPLSVGVRTAQAAGTAASPAVKQKIRAAFVLLETIDDQGWTTSHHDGIEYLKQKLGDRVEVVIQKVDVLRHQIDLAVVLAEDDGAESAADGAADADPSAGSTAEFGAGSPATDASELAPTERPEAEDSVQPVSLSEG